MSGMRRSGKGALFLVLMIDSLTIGLFIPLSLLYLTSRTGASLPRVGVLLSIAGLIALPLPLLTGRLVDRIDARGVVLAAQFLQATGFLGYVLVGSLPAVFLSATIASLGRTAFSSSIYTLLSAVSDHDPDPRARERWFGRAGALRAVGYGVGAALAGLALAVNAQHLYQWLIAGNTALLLVAAGLLITLVPRPVRPPGEHAAGERGYQVLWADRPYLGLVAVNVLFALCNVTLSIGFAPYVARALPGLTWVVGPLLTMNTVVQALCQPLVVRLVRGLPRPRSLNLAGLLWAAWALGTATALVLPGSWRVPALALAVACYSAAQMVHVPVANAIAVDAAPVDVRGRYLAVFQLSFPIATVIAPTLFSTLLDTGHALPWLALAGVALLTIPGLLLLTPRLPQAAVTGIRTHPAVSSGPGGGLQGSAGR